MELRTVGFYKEMTHGGDDDPSLYDFINKEDPDRADKICSYLNQGFAFMYSRAIVGDVINPENKMAGTASLITDGRWLWPGDLAYYVRKYNLKLPDEFIATMEENDWEVTMDAEDLDDDEYIVNGEELE